MHFARVEIAVLIRTTHFGTGNEHTNAPLIEDQDAILQSRASFGIRALFMSSSSPNPSPPIATGHSGTVVLHQARLKSFLAERSIYQDDIGVVIDAAHLSHTQAKRRQPRNVNAQENPKRTTRKSISLIEENANPR